MRGEKCRNEMGKEERNQKKKRINEKIEKIRLAHNF